MSKYKNCVDDAVLYIQLRTRIGREEAAELLNDVLGILFSNKNQETERDDEVC